MIERSVTFGADDGLVGTIVLPDGPGGAAAGIGVLLFNAGMVHRVGPHRFNVRLSRQLAARGIPSIRFDLAGHGDSARLTGQHSFEEQAVVDVRAAMDALGAAAQVRRFGIFGHCSGAYHGYGAALADERVVGLLMLDAYRYPTFKTHAYHYLTALRQPHFARRVLGFVGRGLSGLGRWRRPPAGRIAAEHPVPELGRVNFIPSKEVFAEGLKVLLARGVRLGMVYSGGEIRHYNYREQFRDTFAPFGIGDRIPVEFLPDSDHQATTLASQAALARLILAWGGELLADGAPAAARTA
ncbi:MAG TPA: alpha/beta fold hydrolase [Gemmatimonadales bacterium]|nr:alpha/beta fold hydrolase [Gemmatimonadales bacterium]